MKKLLLNIKNSIITFFSELKLVEWLSPKKTFENTLLVIVISVFIGIIVVVFDIVLLKAISLIYKI